MLDLSGEYYSPLLPSAKEMRRFDAYTINDLGTASLELMNRVAQQASQIINNRYTSESEILVLSGPGNNGGDGVALARELWALGFDCNLLLCSDSSFSKDHKSQLETLQNEYFFYGKSDALTKTSISLSDLNDLVLQADVIIDAILGTGQNEAPRGSLAELVEVVNQHTAEILAIDVPTGVNSDSGGVYEPSIAAELCITVQMIKRGMLQFPAINHVGEIVIIDIGIQADGDPEFKILDNTEVHIAKRAINTHKGSYGKALIVAGSREYPGAAKLAANACMQSGAGLVYKLQLPIFDTYGMLPEIMYQHCRAQSDFFTKDVLADLDDLSDYDAILLGPGIGQDPETAELVVELSKQFSSNWVLDADCLNLIAENSKISDLKSAIITPHPKEAARMLGASLEEIQSDRYRAAKDLAHKYNCTAVLKGAQTVIYADNFGFVNYLGNPYMASAGVGDVLAGLLTALIAQGYQGIEAAKSAVFIHALAGDLVHEQSAGPMTASALSSYLTYAFGTLLNESESSEA